MSSENCEQRRTRAGLPGLRRAVHSLQEGFDVLGGYMSPVNDAYGKPDLAPATHRSAAAELDFRSFRWLDHH